MLSVAYYWCAECHYAECRYAECRYAECRYAECRYAKCRYAERRGAVTSTYYYAEFFTGVKSFIVQALQWLIAILLL